MRVDHIIAILILEQSASALLCSRRLFVCSLLLWCLGFRTIGIILRSWSHFIWAVLEQKTWKVVFYPRDLSTRGTSNQMSHADFVVPKMTFRWLRIYESVSKVLNDPPLVRRK
jgi:hypothetical protein